MKKAERQQLIREIITTMQIERQDDLVNELNDKGVSATQATISRDIREMQIVKSADGAGELKYTIFKAGNRSEENRLYTTINDVVTNVVQVEFMNIVRTLPSDGNLLAAIIDDLDMPEVAGTLAGHDTIFIISPNQTIAKKFNQKIKEHVNDNIYLD